SHLAGLTREPGAMDPYPGPLDPSSKVGDAHGAAHDSAYGNLGCGGSGRGYRLTASRLEVTRPGLRSRERETSISDPEISSRMARMRISRRWVARSEGEIARHDLVTR